jgi:quercetin dioxygenase-like cupin family protein
MPATLQLTPTERVTVLPSAAGTLAVEVVHEPGGSPPPVHLHPGQDERFTVLEGEATVRIGREERILRAGDVVEVPRGTPHTFWNAAGDPARLRWETTPPGRTLEWWRALDAAGPKPGLRRMAALLTEFDDVFRLVVPLRPVVYAALRVLAERPRRSGGVSLPGGAGA